MRLIKKLLWLVLILVVISQFFGPERNEGDIASIEPFLRETNPPEKVKYVLKETCFDCHSNHTRYPWYSWVTPLDYWMAGHVDHGKEELNFSDWSEFSVKKKDHKLEEVIELVQKKEMPLPSYTWTHREANLTDEQIEAVVSWAQQIRNRYNLED